MFSLSCQSLSFTFSNKVVFQNVSLSLVAGEKVWIKGASGSGKSTFLKILAGLLPSQSGLVNWGETSLDAHRFKHFRLFVESILHMYIKKTILLHIGLFCKILSFLICHKKIFCLDWNV